MPRYNDYHDDYYDRPHYSSHSSYRHSQPSPRTYGTYIHDSPPHDYYYTQAVNPPSSKRYKDYHDEYEGSAPRSHYRNSHSHSSHKDEGYGSEHSSTRDRQRQRSPRPYSYSSSSSTQRSSSTQPSSRSSKHHHSSSKHSKPRTQDIDIQVKDCTTSQRLRNLYGKRFTIVLTAASRHKDIIDFLAPETGREKVVVRWPGGEYEELDELVPIAELTRQGARLEVKNRKRVHWQ